MNYQNWYGNNGQYYMQNLQDMRDRIDNQMKQYQQNQMQMQQPQMPTNLTQNFQLAPTTNNNNEIQAKYVNSIDDVKNTFVMTTGLFVNKEMNTLWIKNVNGDIRIFNLQEIIEMDERDKEIIRLNNQIRELQQSLKENNNNSIEKENNKEKKSNKKD